MPSPRLTLGSALLLAAALGGCNTAARAPVAAPAAPLAAPLAVLPGGTGCGASIARTRAVVDSDIATGNLDQPVGTRFRADLDRANAACAAGRDGEALRELAAAKSRYGYPG